MDRRAQRLRIGAGFAVIYVLTLFLPVAREGVMGYGHQILISGWLGVFMYQFGWFANVCFFVLLRSMTYSHRPVRWVGWLVAILLALFTINALFWRVIPNANGDRPITEYGIGYYLWLVCMTGMIAWTFIRMMESVTTDPSDTVEKSL